MKHTDGPTFSHADLLIREKDIEPASHSLKAMAHPLRIKILCVLGDQEACVLDIVSSVGTSQSNISQHLGILYGRGVLESRKEGKKVFYRMADSKTLKFLDMMQEVFCSRRG